MPASEVDELVGEVVFGFAVDRDGGQGGFEIRTFVAVAGATEGATGEVWFYEPIPIFAVGCTVATMDVR